jgi:hypothetical protein
MTGWMAYYITALLYNRSFAGQLAEVVGASLGSGVGMGAPWEPLSRLSHPLLDSGGGD